MVVWLGLGWGEVSRKDYKGTGGNFRGDEYVHYVDSGNDMSVYFIATS